MSDETVGEMADGTVHPMADDFGDEHPPPPLDPYADLDQAAQDVVVRLLAERPRTVEELRLALAKESVFIDLETLRGVLTWPILGHELAGGAFVHLPSLADGTVFTHRLTGEERDLGVLDGSVDLALIAHLADEPLPLAGGHQVRVRYAISDEPLPEGTGVGLLGPDGWLEGFPAGSLLALRYAGGQLEVSVLDEDPEADEAISAEFVRAAWAAAELNDEDEEADPGVSVDDIVLEVLAGTPGAFSEPRPPLSELLDSTELEVERGYVGVPGTIWEGEPAFLNDEELAVYRTWRRAAHRFSQLGTVPSVDELSTLGHGLHGIVLALAAADVTTDPDLDGLLERLAEASHPARLADAVYLRARAAEGRGDLTAWVATLEAVLELDHGHRDAAADLAELRAVAGDAHETQRLLRAAGIPDADPEMQAVRPFLSVPEGEVGRNKPCPCGSGKKYKMCHGRTARHPLSSRSSWLWHKVGTFAQRGQRREELLEWASLFSGEAPDHSRTIGLAMGDSFVQDAAIVDGGLLDEFVDVLGPLLPEDELTLVREWSEAPRRLMEVERVLPMRGVRVRDLLTEEAFEVRDRHSTTQVETKDLLFGRPLDDGSGALRFFSSPVMVPRLMRGPLLGLLRDGAPAPHVLRYLAGGGRPAQLQNTEGQELVLCTARYESADPDRLWAVLSAGRDADDDRIVVGPPGHGGGTTVRATFTRDGDRVVLETNSVERLREHQELVREADPSARLVDESTRPFSMDDLPGAPAPATESPDLPPELIEQIVRGQEEEWLSEPVPALGGRTPRQAAEDPSVRGELEALLDDFEWADRRSANPLTMDVARLRRELGLA